MVVMEGRCGIMGMVGGGVGDYGGSGSINVCCKGELLIMVRVVFFLSFAC